MADSCALQVVVTVQIGTEEGKDRIQPTALVLKYEAGRKGQGRNDKRVEQESKNHSMRSPLYGALFTSRTTVVMEGEYYRKSGA
jgi:hypothetical protein